MLLFDGGEAPLASFGPVLSAKAARALRKLGVEQHMHSIVTQVDLSGLAVRGPDGEVTEHEAGTVLWTAGVEAPPLATAIATATGAQQDRSGRILVQPDLTIPGHPEISVTGDMMNRDGLPGVAEVAMQAGLYAGPAHPARAGWPAAGPGVPLPRPGLGRLRVPRQRRGLGGPPAPGRLPGLVGVAGHPHRLHDRVP